MCVKKPQRKRTKNATSRRKMTIEYYLTTNDDAKIAVCRTMFTQTFNISVNRIRVLIDKIIKEIDVDDRRGTHCNRPNKLAPEDTNNAIKHIASFSTVDSHYSRSKSTKAYLPPDLSVNKMHAMFKNDHPDSSVTYRSYLRIFNSNFKLGFGLPRSDTCKLCDELFMQMVNCTNENEMSDISKKLESHHETAENAYLTLNTDTHISTLNSNCVVLCVDLQQVILTPNLTHSDMYYQRQYSNYNFGIHNMGSNIGNMYIWHEQLGKRGSAEIASCILKYITNNFNPLENGEIRKLIVWSDRCVGQNNNWTVISLYHYLINLNYFTEVNQKFLTSGHSFLPCDRDFAIIEKNKRISQLYVPKDVVNMIKTAKKENPFLTYEMQLQDFKDFSDITNQLTKTNKCKITKARWIQLTADDPNTIKLRNSHDLSEPWSNYLLKDGKNKKNIKSLPNPDSLEVLRKDKIEICENKKKDIRSMLKYLPTEEAQFYEDICN